MSSVECFDEYYARIGKFKAPFDEEINCNYVRVEGEDLSGMVLKGKCRQLVFLNVYNYNEVDLSGFMDLEIEEFDIGFNDEGLLKLLELNCKKVDCNDTKLQDIMNKYLQEELDPPMRDIQGCKYELAINGYGDRL